MTTFNKEKLKEQLLSLGLPDYSFNELSEEMGKAAQIKGDEYDGACLAQMADKLNMHIQREQTEGDEETVKSLKSAQDMLKKAAITELKEPSMTPKEKAEHAAQMYPGESSPAYVYSENGRQRIKVYPYVALTAGEKGELPSEIQLVPVGAWDTIPYGKIKISADDIAEMVSNFNKKVRAGVPIDIEHGESQLYKTAAAGWISGVSAKADGLWGSVTWNDLGKKLLGDQQYKFLSPEFHPEYVDPENKSVVLNNVLIAGSLVNRPLFKELKPLTASEGLTSNGTGITLFIEPMKLDDLRKKTMAELNDGEKKFLNDHMGELTDEEKKKFGMKGSESSENPAITAAEVEKLKADALAGREALSKLQAMEVENEVGAMIFSEDGKGHFPPAQRDSLTSFYKSLNTEQRKVFSEIVEKLPTPKIFEEMGSSEAMTVEQKKDALTVKAQEVLDREAKNGKKLTLGQATKIAARENPELANYKLVPVASRAPVKGE